MAGTLLSCTLQGKYFFCERLDIVHFRWLVVPSGASRARRPSRPCARCGERAAADTTQNGDVNTGVSLCHTNLEAAIKSGQASDAKCAPLAGHPFPFTLLRAAVELWKMCIEVKQRRRARGKEMRARQGPGDVGKPIRFACELRVKGLGFRV